MQCYGLEGQQVINNGTSERFVHHSCTFQSLHDFSVSSDVLLRNEGPRSTIVDRIRFMWALTPSILTLLLNCLIEVAFFFVILVSLTSRAVAFGRYYAWREHVSQLGWFGELPGYPSEAIYPRAPGYGQPYPGANYVHQLPGHSIVVQPGVNGGQPIINQIPGVITNV